MINISIVIPIYNEEYVLKKEIIKIIKELGDILGENQYEILLVNNGSTDQTLNIANELATKNNFISIINLKKPAYGEALRLGINQSKGDYVTIFNIDFWDIGFLKSSIMLLKTNEYAFIVGSKLIANNFDNRGIFRKFISIIFNHRLMLFFGFM